MPYHRARDWVRELASDPRTLVRGMYMAFTESDFDAEQLNRFDGLIPTRGRTPSIWDACTPLRRTESSTFLKRTSTWYGPVSRSMVRILVDRTKSARCRSCARPAG